jgi:hypothetical protein
MEEQVHGLVSISRAKRKFWEEHEWIAALLKEDGS